MNAVPLFLSLPDGPAVLVPGSFERGQPRYQRDGQVLDVDVTIPPELEATGWIWHGSFLRKPGAVGIAICTTTFPPPLCFDNARELDRLEAARDTAPQRQTKRRKRQQALLTEVSESVEATAPAQLVMELL